MNVSIADLQARLPELLDQLQPGECLTIVRDQKAIARLIAEPNTTSIDQPNTPHTKEPLPKRKLGQQPGALVFMSTDFNATLDMFE